MEQFEEINLKRIFDALISKIAFIVAFTFIVGIGAFVYSETMATTKYASSVSLYVNNEQSKTTKKVLGSDIAASQMLVDTYIVMIKSNTVLDQVLNILVQNGVEGYTVESLRNCISAVAVDETEVFEITITAENPAQTYMIANVIADVAPKIIQGFVEASSIKVIDYANEGKKVSPNVKQNTLIGLIIGLILACAIVVVGEMFDMRIKTEDDLDAWEIPVLGIIPDIDLAHGGRNGYYYYRRHKKSDEHHNERKVSEDAGTERHASKDELGSKAKTNSK